MRRIERFACGLALATWLPGVALEARSLEDVRRASSQDDVYRQPTREALSRAGDLFLLLFLGGVSRDDLRGAWRELGFDLLEIEQRDESFLVVTEQNERREGRGLFVFRTRSSKPIALQAPHSFFDKGTGELVERMFLEGRAAAAAWNTCSRKSRFSGRNADLAHLERSYFQEFTAAFQRRHPEGLIVQVHGFRRASRSTKAARSASMILSDGTRTPGRWILALPECLQSRLGVRPLLFPRDVAELGGTRNAQGKLLRRLGRGRFLHVELSEEMRARLSEEKSATRGFLGCLPGR